jgi:hypothetical protein
MDPGVQPTSTTGGESTLWDRITDWFLLEGQRWVIAAAIVVVFTGIVGALVSVGVLAVGPGSSVASLFGSGLTAGIVTLVTIALSINQLILSRVFGSPNELLDRLEGSRELRGRVEELAGRPSSPNDPAAFLSLVATTVSERATTALSMTDAGDSKPPIEVTRTLEDVAEYGRNIDSRVNADTPVVDVLGVIVGSEYAINMVAVRHLRNEHAGALSAEVEAELGAVDELLESVAVLRQFFKTLALQQDFATLSRLLVYSSLAALLVSASLTLVYRTGSTTLATSTLSIVVPLGLGAAVTPFAVFAAYILRGATVAHRTVSVGPFVPPEER